MEETAFDTEFRRLTTGMVEIAFEYIGANKAESDAIYIYASLENEIYSYNVFYRINGEVVDKEQVNDLLVHKIDDSDERMDALLSTGGHAVMDLSDVFIGDKREVPTLLKMVYAPKTGAFGCEVIYEPQYADRPGRTNADGFRDWRKAVMAG